MLAFGQIFGRLFTLKVDFRFYFHLKLITWKFTIPIQEIHNKK